MSISRIFLSCVLAVGALGCGKQEGALSPTATKPDKPSTASEASASSGGSPEGVGYDGDGYGRKSGLAQRRVGAPFFHGTWVSERGWSKPAGREGAAVRGSKSSAKSAKSMPPQPRKGPAIQQMLRSISLSLDAENKIELRANGTVQSGRYSVEPISKTAARIKARFESGAAAVEDAFIVHAQDHSAQGRAQLRLEVNDGRAAPLMLVEGDPQQ